MRTLVLGDVHGNLKALRQVLKRSAFDAERDRLVSLGDLYDGHPESADCVELLTGVKNFIWVLGNHDEQVRRWFRDDWKGNKKKKKRWLKRGGGNTILSYLRDGKLRKKLFKRHAGFIERAVLYFIDEKNRLYVHAGLDWGYPVDKQRKERNYYRGRDTFTIESVRREEAGEKFPYEYVFIGHTATNEMYPDCRPVRRANLWNLDQGAGKDGKLTIMDADTFEYWQSGG
ncbi:MAG: metallophosphoesterase [Deltaproteobacteria bacterium]